MLRLTVEPLDLGPDVRAVQLELVDPEKEEPAAGSEAAAVWARALVSLAGEEPCGVDFFAHLDRVEQFVKGEDLESRKTSAGGIVVTEKDPDALARLFERFEAETFGFRAGAAVDQGDAELEGDLRRRGLDAYHRAYARYAFCAICDLASGSITLVSDRLWASEVSRRLRPALKQVSVAVEMLM